MLIGSVVTGLISYYLNAFYSGRFLSYTIGEQIKDILPSFLIALFMAAVVFAVSFISLPPLALLLIQLSVAAAVLLAVCEIVKPDSYLEIRSMVLSYIKK